MNRKPIGPTAHGAIDYGFFGLLVLAPTLFGLKGVAKTVAYVFAANTGITNALTDHPLGLLKVISLRTHGRLETPVIPVLLLLPWATGALKQPNALRFFLGFFAMAFANYLLTDYNAYESADKPPHATHG